MEISSEFFEVLGHMIGFTLVDLFLIWLGGSVQCKLRDNQ